MSLATLFAFVAALGANCTAGTTSSGQRPGRSVVPHYAKTATKRQDIFWIRPEATVNIVYNELFETNEYFGKKHFATKK
jgi:hypothetical protein